MSWPTSVVDWALYVAIGLVLALLGNALYEYIFRPALRAVARVLARTVRAASKSVFSRMTDSVVAAAAERPTELCARILLITAIYLAIVASAATLSAARSEIFGSPVSAEYKNALAEANALATVEEREALLKSLSTKVKKEMAADKRSASVARVVIAYLLFIYLLVAFARASLVRLVMRLFDKRFIILRPKLSDIEAAELQSAFASMKTRMDFGTLLARLEKLAERPAPSH